MSTIKKMKKRLAKIVLPHLPASLMHFPVSGFFMIEPSNRCNLKCPLCPTSNAMTRKREDLSFENFAYIIDEVSPHIKKLALWNFGEPFLNKDIFKMISYAEEKDIYVVTSTNSTIWDSAIYNGIFESGLSEIIVCLDGASKCTHEAYRVGSDFDKTVSGIRKLCLARQNRKFGKPLITLQFVVMKDNENEVDGIISLARDLGVDRLSLKSVSLGSWVSDVQRKINADKYLPQTKSLRRYQVEEKGVVVDRDVDICSWSLRNGVVLSNGDITTCCYDYDGRHKIGNAFKSSYLDFLKSARYKKIRKHMVSKKFALCSQCQFGYIELKPIVFK